MNFLLDTDTCSAHMRRPSQLAHRFIQYSSRLAIPTILLAELYAGAYKHPNPAKLLALIADLLQEVQVIEFDSACAERFGQVRGTLLQKGITVSRMDLLIASVALVHNLTLVTHNTAVPKRPRPRPGRLVDPVTASRGLRISAPTEGSNRTVQISPLWGRRAFAMKILLTKSLAVCQLWIGAIDLIRQGGRCLQDRIALGWR